MNAAPKARQGTAAPGKRDLIAGTRLPGVRLLIVDDNEDSRRVLEDVFRHLGATVTVAASAASALETFHRVKPDLVISDIAMPHHDGYWLRRQLAALPPERGGGTPVIAITAHRDIHHAQRARRAGFQGYLTKPIEFRSLVEIVATLLG
jgi:CheY-like chemotaxis protein